MIVIQDQDQVARQPGDLVQQADHRRFSAAQLGRADDLARLVAHLRVDGLDRGDEVGPKADRVVVALSRESQAAVDPAPPSQLVTRVDLPNPAGAETNASFRARPRVQALGKVGARHEFKCGLGDV